MKVAWTPSLVAAVLACACGDDPAATPDPTLTFTVEGLPAGTLVGATTLAGLTLVVNDGDGAPVGGLAVDLEVAAGGGSVTPADVVTDGEGRATFSWTVGPLPVPNVVRADAGERGAGESRVDVDTAAATLRPTAFGNVDAFLTDEAIEGSTEDLAFSPDGKIVMGVPGALLSIGTDGGATRMAIGGEALGRPLGLAFDHDGRLWIADGDKDALMMLGSDDVVVKVADRDGDQAFVAPNDVAVGPDGTVYMSDTCTGKFLALDDDGTVIARAVFDPKADGGPNGVVVGPDGALWVTTENTGLFCAHDDIDLTASVAGLYRLPILEDGTFGAREAIATGVGVFGDGLAFDQAGNLFVIFDTIEGLALDESIVFALPKGGTALRRVFAVRERVWANLAFGRGAFGDTTLYLSLLAVPPFTSANARGLERVRVDVGGAPLPAPLSP